MGWISYGWALAMAIAIVPTIKKTGPFEIWTFLSRLQIDFDKLSGFQMVGLPDFRSCSKSRPFATQPIFDHSKSRLVRISDPHCNMLPI